MTRDAAQQKASTIRHTTRPQRGRRSLIALAAVGLLASASLVGCSSASSDGVTTLRFMQNKREVVQYFDGVIADFEAQNPDITVVQDFMPKQLSDADVRANIAAIITETGAAGPKDMGKVMAVLKERYAGQMDFSKASGAVKELLN